MSGIIQALLASLPSANSYRLYSWGTNSYGQLGQNNVTTLSSPVQIGALTDWGEAFIGDTAGIATRENGTIWSWGQNNSGSLGLSLVASPAALKSSPTQIGALTDWYDTGLSQLSAGQFWMTAVKSNGSIWAWGNSSAQQIVSSGYARSSPIQLGASGWLKVATKNGAQHAVAIATDGTMWSWGYGSGGRLGNNTATTRAFAGQIGALTTWQECSVGSTGSAAIKNDNTLWVWGLNSGGRLGTSTSYTVSVSSPVQVGALTDWAQISLTTATSVAVKTDGTLWAWGANSYGILGQSWPFFGLFAYRSSPIQVGSLTNWSSVVAGVNNMLAIKTDGTLWGWGRNNNGVLGLNNIISRSSPVQVGSGTNWHKIATSGFASFGITKN